MNEGTCMGNGRNYYWKEEVNHVCEKAHSRYTTSIAKPKDCRGLTITTLGMRAAGLQDQIPKEEQSNSTRPNGDSEFWSFRRKRLIQSASRCPQ